MQTSFAKQTGTDRLFGWWYAIAVPPSVPENAPLREREFMRRSKLVSIILLIEILLLAVDFSAGAEVGPSVDVPVSLNLLAMLIGVLLNRKGYTRAASILVLTVTELGMCAHLLSRTLMSGGLMTEFDLVPFTILLQADVIAVSLFSALVVLPIGAFNCLFTAALITFTHKNPELLQLFHIMPFVIYYLPISTHIVVICVGLFWTSTVFQEMNRADRAEEVSGLIQALAAQQQQALQEKQQLEESIQQIVEVHTQVANGNLNARVPLDQGNILWVIAGSLNNLLARLQSWRQEAQQQEHTVQAIQFLHSALQKAKREGTPLHIRKTGTMLDPIIAELTNNPSLVLQAQRGMSRHSTHRSESGALPFQSPRLTSTPDQ